MNALQQFQSFVKRSNKNLVNHSNTIIYARVLSIYQKDDTGLKDQQDECINFAKNLKLNIINVFGGFYASDSKEHKNQLDEIIDFIKKK